MNNDGVVGKNEFEYLIRNVGDERVAFDKINLSGDIDQDDIIDYICNIRIKNIRLWRIIFYCTISYK